MVLGSLNIDHNILVQTPCIHIRLSEDVVIVPFLHSPLEGRYVVIFDVPGAYLNADMPEDKLIILKIEG